MRKVFVIATLLLAGCSFAPKDTGNAFMFHLKPLHLSRQGPESATLVVALPAAPAELDTARIALLRDGGQWDYYAAAKWADFMPTLVQDNIINTLEASRVFKAVASDQSGITGDRILKTEIRDFQAEYTPGSTVPVVKVRLSMSVLTRVDRARLASFTVAGQKKASANTLAAIQAAFNDAFNAAQRQLLETVSKSAD